MDSIKGTFFEAILLSALEVSFEFMEFLLPILLSFLSSFVLCSLCFIFNLFGTINDLIRVYTYVCNLLSLAVSFKFEI